MPWAIASAIRSSRTLARELSRITFVPVPHPCGDSRHHRHRMPAAAHGQTIFCTPFPKPWKPHSDRDACPWGQIRFIAFTGAYRFGLWRDDAAHRDFFRSAVRMADSAFVHFAPAVKALRFCGGELTATAVSQARILGLWWLHSLVEPRLCSRASASMSRRRKFLLSGLAALPPVVSTSTARC